MDGLNLQSNWPLALLPVAARVAGLLLVAPIFGHAAVPARLRVLLALVVGLAVLDRAAPAAAPSSLGELVLTCGIEFLFGAAMGWAAGLLFAGVELAAAHVGTQMGLSLGEALGGGGDEDSGPVGSVFRIVAIAAFLLIGGHRELLGGLLDTLRIVPVGGVAMKASVLGLAGALLQASFVLALKVAAPVLIAMLLATVAMGFLNRSLPACHILSTGLPVRAMLGLLVMAMSLAGLAWAVQAAWRLTGKTLADFMVGLG
jgi:flagellar biosynthesis protein FliR